MTPSRIVIVGVDYANTFAAPRPESALSRIELARGISVGRFSIELARLQVSPLTPWNPASCVIEQRYEVLDRESGAPTPLTWEYPLPEFHSRPVLQSLELVRRAIVLAVTHEIDEHLYLDGVRVFDPHRPTLGWPR